MNIILVKVLSVRASSQAPNKKFQQMSLALRASAAAELRRARRALGRIIEMA